MAPLYNEASCVDTLVEALRAALSEAADTWEVVLVDDHSDDETAALIERWTERDPRVRGVRLSRNMGQHRALLCGLELARGDAVVTLDGDMQHPPDLIPTMVARWREGADVVSMVKSGRGHSGFPDRVSAFLASIFYLLFNLLADVRLTPNVTEFRLLDRQCRDAVLAMRDRGPYLKARVAAAGFRQVEMTYDCPPRAGGRSFYTLRKRAQVGLDAILSSSRRVLMLPSLLGVALLVSAVPLHSLVSASTAEDQAAVAHWLPLMVGVGAAVAGLCLLSIALVGAWLARLLATARSGPDWFIEAVFEREPVSVASADALSEPPSLTVAR